MTNAETTHKSPLTQCSQCGSTDALEVRSLACAAISEWNKTNYPAPGYTTITSRDDIRRWEISLCKTCLPKSYRFFLNNQVASAKTALSICIPVIIIAVGIVSFVDLKGSPPYSSLRALVVGSFLLGLVAFVVGVERTINFVLSLRRRKELEQSGVVPVKRLDQSFIGEGQRIIKALVSGDLGSPEKVWGVFPLPEHKTVNQLENPPEEKNITRKREIVATGLNVEALEQALPSVWRPMWDNKKQIYNW